MFARNVLHTFSTEVFSVGIKFLIGVVLARMLTPADRGMLVLVMTLPLMVISFGSLGLPQANVYLVGRKHHDARAVLGTSLVMSLIIGLVLVALLQMTKETVLRTALGGLAPEYWWLLMVLIPVSLLQAMALSMLRARQQFGAFNLQRLGTSVMQLVGFAVGLAWARGGLSVAVGVYVATIVLSAVLSLALTGREVPLSFAFDRRLAGASLRFGLKSYLQNLVGKLNYRLDMYLLAALLTPEQVAFYGVATSVAEVAWYIPNSVGVVLFPHLSNAPADTIHEITARVCRVTVALTALVAVGLAVVGWLVVPLVYGPAYGASVPPLWILLPGVLSMAVYKVLTRNFTSRNRQQVAILASMLALTLNVGLDLLLIPRWRVVGAATASTVGYTAAGAVLLLWFLRDSGLTWQETLLPRFGELVGYWQRIRDRLCTRLRQVRG